MIEPFSRHDDEDSQTTVEPRGKDIDPYMGVSGDLILLLHDAAEILLLDPTVEASAGKMMDTVVTMYFCPPRHCFSSRLTIIDSTN